MTDRKFPDDFVPATPRPDKGKLTTSAHANETKTEINPKLELYGFIHLHTNYVSVDKTSTAKDTTFIGLSDAYSRLGAAFF